MKDTKAVEGTLRHSLLQFAKRIAFRSSMLNWLSKPHFPYGLEPAALAFLVAAIDATRDLKGAIVEVGVARGMTTVFLNEHLTSVRDGRRYICVDTFSGFTADDVSHEVAQRGKKAGVYSGFSYNDPRVFKKNVASYARIAVIPKDCKLLTREDLGAVSLAVIDVDLYRPTQCALEAIYPLLEAGGTILVDDVKPDGIYDGARAAYLEFCDGKALPAAWVGTKAGVVSKPRQLR